MSDSLSDSVSDLDVIYDRLASTLRDHAEGLVATRDDSDQISYQTTADPPEFFGAVMRRKAQVAYHLMPVYRDPSLLDSISPALRKRMQGKSCFTIHRIDDALVADLADLTARCRQAALADGD